MNLSRWNPFRFTRRAGADGRSDGSQHASQGQQQQQGQAASGSQQMGSPGVPQAWLDRGGLPDPLRMMATMMSHPFGSLTRLDRWFGDFSPAAFEPRIDVVDRGDAIQITAELPGVERKDVQVTLEDDYLLLSGEKRLERKEEEQGAYRVERAFGAFQRVVPLPEGVDTRRAEATFDNGTLTIRLPKDGKEGGGRRLEIREPESGASASPGARSSGGAQQS